MSSIKKSQLRQTAKVISQAGFYHFLRQFDLQHLLPHWHLLFKRKRLGAVPSATLGRLLAQLGPGFVLAGRIASLRADLVGGEYQGVLRELDYSPQALSQKEIWQLLRRELGRGVEKIFSHLYPEPISHHLLGFTYRAILKNGKRALLVINNPKEVERLHRNLDELRWLLDWVLPRFSKNQARAWHEIWSEVVRQADNLADLTQIGGQMEIFLAHTGARRKFLIPEVIWEHTTPRLLMQRTHKLPTFSDILFGRQSGAGAKKYLIRRLLEFFVYQYGTLGHFLLQPKLEDWQATTGNRVVANNFLGTAWLEPELRRAFVAFLYCTLKHDSHQSGKIFLKLHYLAATRKEPQHPSFVVADNKGAATSKQLRYLLERAWHGHIITPLPFVQAVESVCFLEELVTAFDFEADFAYIFLSVLQAELPKILGVKKGAGVAEVVKQIIK